MGAEVEREEFTAADRARFAARLRDSLQALREVLARPGFGVGPASVGAELELDLVGPDARPLPRNREVLARAADRHLTVELDRFNVECNAEPAPLAGRPFAALGADLEGALARVRAAAAGLGGRVVPVGILPTLRPEHLTREALTERPRYRALSAGIRALRDAPLHLRLDGDEPLALDVDDVACIGACTSFQVHLRADPAAFAATFNAAQLATAPLLAASGNSPLFLGHKLWRETRIALFAQGSDDRGPQAAWRIPRVGLGQGWVRQGIAELFESAVALHAPLLPICGLEDPLAEVRAGRAPHLAELRLHAGTTWPWNRGVYDPAGGGHVRVELRALPAGPTVADMLANAAFALGLTLALRPEMERLLPAMPFAHAERSFLRAARDGLGAELLWPAAIAPSPRPEPARALVARLVPLAREALVASGVEPEEADRHLGVFLARAESGRTGAEWQRRALDRLESRLGREAALAALVEAYLERSLSGEPVHTWSEP